VLPRPVISTPKLAAGEAIQDCTCVVTSTSRNEFATVAVVDPNVAPIVGWLLKETPVSVQDEVTREKFSVPPVVTLLT
jgi:hypothetical protein